MENLKILASVTKVESEKFPNLKALGSVQIGGIVIDNVRVVEREYEKDGEKRTGTFVDFPQHKGKDKDGQDKWSLIASFGNSQNEELGEKIKKAVISTVLEAYKSKEKTSKFFKETDIEYDNDKVNAYIRPVDSEKIKGEGSIYYGNILTINPVFLKEGVSKESGEKTLFISLEQRKDKENNYRDIVYPVEKGLRAKFNEVCINSYNKNLEAKQEQGKEEKEDFSIEDSEFYKELDSMSDEINKPTEENEM